MGQLPVSAPSLSGGERSGWDPCVGIALVCLLHPLSRRGGETDFPEDLTNRRWRIKRRANWYGRWVAVGTWVGSRWCCIVALQVIGPGSEASRCGPAVGRVLSILLKLLAQDQETLNADDGTCELNEDALEVATVQLAVVELKDAGELGKEFSSL